MLCLLFVFVFATSIFTQINPLNTSMLANINASLTTIVTQNNLGAIKDREKIVQLISQAQSAIETVNTLRNMDKYAQELRSDIAALGKFQLNDLSKVKNFIVNGDKVDYWMTGTSHKLMSDTYKLKKAENNINEFTSTLSDLIQDEQQKEVSKAVSEMANIDGEIYDANLKQIELNQLKITALKKSAEDPSIKLTPAERSTMLNDAANLESKNADLFEKNIELAKRNLKKKQAQLDVSMTNKAAGRILKTLYEFTKSATSYGLFNSTIFKTVQNEPSKWGSNY